jgi:Uma2 family endonuclease
MLIEHDILERLGTQAAAHKHIYYGMAWSEYESLVNELEENSHLRLTYDQGVLEIMSPKKLHEQITRLVDMIVALLALELGINIDNCGSMTMKEESIESGGEPDSCYYIAHEKQVRGLEEIDLRIHPPPDIVLEIDITSPSLDKMRLYAAMGVVEVWRHDNSGMKFYVLEEGEQGGYKEVEKSRSFPHLRSEMMTRYITIGRSKGTIEMLREVKNEIA